MMMMMMMMMMPINPIGLSYYGSVVYRAVAIDRRQRHRRRKKTYFAVTVSKASYCSGLRHQIYTYISNCLERNSYHAKPNNNNNLLETKEIVRGDGGRTCVVFPYCDMGSLRSIMRNAYPLGFPEDLILIGLRSVLKALSFIHSNFTNHRDINAAHIYLNSTPPEIKLGFAATIYRKTRNTLLPSDKIDVWLVGITALELAYGGLRVENRDALEAMMNERKRNKLKHYVGKFCYSSTHDDDDDDEEDIIGCSEAFTKMVLGCLDGDPENRPSVDDLLSSQLFTNTKDARYFYRALLKKYNS